MYHIMEDLWIKTKNLIEELWTKYKSLIIYAFVGGLTTVVNIVTYYVCFNLLGIANDPSTAIAWLLSVLFAFLPNKLWVFESKSFDKQTVIQEFTSFFSCRLATGILDFVIMHLAVTVAHFNPTLWKLISNILVIIINYVVSKLLIFKKKD